MASWLKETWLEVKPNAKWDIIKWCGYAVAAMLAGLGTVWHKLSWWQLIVSGCSFLSGWAALAVHVFRQPGKDRTLHIAYAGYGLGGDRYKDVTILVRGYIKSNKLNVPVSNETFLGDPYGGAKKHIVIRYRIGSGREVEIVRHEHDQLILPTDEDQTAVMRPVTLGERSRHLGDELLQFLAEKGPEPDLSYVKKIPIEVALKEVSKLYDPWLDGVYYGSLLSKLAEDLARRC